MTERKSTQQFTKPGVRFENDMKSEHAVDIFFNDGTKFTIYPPHLPVMMYNGPTISFVWRDPDDGQIVSYMWFLEKIAGYGTRVADDSQHDQVSFMVDAAARGDISEMRDRLKEVERQTQAEMEKRMREGGGFFGQ